MYALAYGSRDTWLQSPEVRRVLEAPPVPAPASLQNAMVGSVWNVPRAGLPLRKRYTATTFAILTVIDMATLFHLAVRSTQTGAAEVFKAFRNLWLNWAGPPEQIILDPDPPSVPNVSG